MSELRKIGIVFLAFIPACIWTYLFSEAGKAERCHPKRINGVECVECGRGRSITCNWKQKDGEK